ncbi:MAG TPA: hypothetical protein PKZ84_06370, partial [Anaerolineae bacterium]|nr:hypothetical protein [Anaerolineae bacterium]HQI83989.1 hypothetical protein [Anaerolineae bacterium]
TWTPMLVLLALYALDRACVRPGWRWWATVLIATSLAFYSHLLAAFLIPVEVLWFWLHPRRRRHAWWGGLAVLTLLTLPYLPMLRWVAPLLLGERETGYPAYSLAEMTTALYSGWTLGVAQGGLLSGRFTVYVALFFGALALVGMGALAWRRRLEALAQLWVWMLVPLLLLWLVSLRGSIFTDRYLIWAAPAFYVLAGAGLATIHHFRHWAIVILLLHVLFLNGVGLYRQATLPIKPQFQAATRYIEAARRPDELLLFQIPYNHYVVAYYAEAPLDPWAEAPFTNWKKEDGSYQVDMAYVDTEMKKLLRNYTHVWLVYSEVALWDERELVAQWLDSHARLLEQRSYSGVTVYYYVLNG